MLKTITNRIASTFKDEDTDIITILDFTHSGNLQSDFVHRDRTKNLIVLVDNTIVMGAVNLRVVRDNSVAATETPMDDDKAVTVGEVVNRLSAMDEQKALVSYFPSVDGTQMMSPVFGVVADGPNTAIGVTDPTQIQNIFTPGGQSLLYVIEKGQDRVTFTIGRNSYQQRLCSPLIQADRAKRITLEPVANASTNTPFYSSPVFWIVLVVLILVIGVIGYMAYNYSSKEKSGEKSTSSKNETVNFGKGGQDKVSLTTSMSAASSPMETISTKLGRLRNFL